MARFDERLMDEVCLDPPMFNLKRMLGQLWRNSKPMHIIGWYWLKFEHDPSHFKTSVSSGLAKLNFRVTELARVSTQQMIRRKSGDFRYGQT